MVVNETDFRSSSRDGQQVSLCHLLVSFSYCRERRDDMESRTYQVKTASGLLFHVSVEKVEVFTKCLVFKNKKRKKI